MLAAPHDLVGLIDPWRKPQPPAGGPRTQGQSLQRAFELRRQCQVEMGSGYSVIWAIAGGYLGGITLMLVGGLWLQLPWMIFVGMAAVAITRALTWAGRNGDRNSGGHGWAQDYRDMYYLLTMSPVPSLIASFEDATAGHDSGDDEAAATNLIARAASDLPEALLRAAQLPDALLTGAEPLPPPANPLPGLLKPLVDWQRSHRSLDSRTRARYCAAYDFFFQPQAAFQAALDQLGTED